jgi:uncharacterized delta-60 repeat protein
MNKLATLILLATITFVNSQTVQLDQNFGINGFATLPMDSDGGSYIINKIQSDGKILVSGQRLNGSIQEDFIARYNQDGTLDTSFGINGFYIFIDSINDVNGPDFLLLNNDSIICIIDDVQGEVTKLNSNGIIDTSFGTNGKMNFTYFNGGTPYLDTNENLYIGTGTSNQLIKINTVNGTIDTSFGTNGIINLGSYFNEIYSFQNNKFLVQSSYADFSTTPTTYYYSIRRFDINGSIDTTFGTNGTLVLYSTTIQFAFDNLTFNVNVDTNNNVIYVTQSSFSSFSATIKKFDANGNQLFSFGGSGSANVPPNNDIIKTQLFNNKLYLAGAYNGLGNYNTSLIRYTSNGDIDESFNFLGVYIENTNSLVEWAEYLSINSDGSIIVSGEYNNGTYNKMYLAKYIDSSLLTTTFGKEFDVKYLNPVENNIEFISNKTISSIVLFNLDGKQVENSNTQNMSITNLASGIYFAKITSKENEVKVIKVVKN